MEQSIILFICLAALIGIFIVLPLLALIMHIIVTLFPYKQVIVSKKNNTSADLAMYAAISTAYKNLYPGTKISEIVETK